MSQHVIGGDAVRQGVRTAGVLRHVAADGAGLLAGGIGRVEISIALHGLRDFEIHDARLEHGAFVRQIDFDNAIHARKRDHDAAGARDHAAAQSGARAPADDGDAVFAGDSNQRRHFLGGLREDHQLRLGLVDAAVVFVQLQVFRAGPDTRAARAAVSICAQSKSFASWRKHSCVPHYICVYV